ncbi:type IV toxin-antitoxin system AbiEi family antitoxin domain-containing protein [Microlunatus speluncae]|uniref:type IV toxin-antitoxin system AbiEi family antitoxin domain-containing protein n=1 Tax=Microlunatus speluncae TaxID=2594267 RepID=UPI0012667163|nr:hypothetical protein [Microlunatus speluncae]
MKKIELTRELVARGFGYDEVARLARRGELVRVRRGAYGRPEASLDDRGQYLRLIRATVAQCSTTTVLSHQSAAAVHGLPLWLDEISRVHLTRSAAGGGKVRHYVHLHPAALDDSDIVVIDGLLVTSLARTVVDLGRAVRLVRSVPIGDAALSRGLAPEALSDVLHRSAGWPGIASARRAVGLLNPLSRSVGESVSRVVMVDLEVPPPVLQFEVLNERDEEVACVDFCWPAQRTVGEFDGKIKYGRLLKPGQSVSDVLFAEKQREDAIRDLGWQVVRWVWDDLRRPDALADRLTRAFARSARTWRSG